MAFVGHLPLCPTARERLLGSGRVHPSFLWLECGQLKIREKFGLAQQAEDLSSNWLQKRIRNEGREANSQVQRSIQQLARALLTRGVVVNEEYEDSHFAVGPEGNR